MYRAIIAAGNSSPFLRHFCHLIILTCLLHLKSCSMGAGQLAQISHLICAPCAELCRGRELLPSSKLSKKAKKRRTSGCLVSFDGKFHNKKMTQDLRKAAKHDPVTGNSRLHFLSNQIVHLTRGKNSVLWSFIQKQIYDQTVCRLHFNIFSSQEEKKNGSPGWRRP